MILVQSGLPKSYWGEAMLCAAVTWNSTGTQEISPYELITGRQPDLLLLKPFRCRVYIHHPPSQQHHMEPRGEKAIFIGYSPEMKGYRIMRDASLKTYLIRSLHDCSFSPDVFPYDNPKVEDHDISQWETDRRTNIRISIPVSQPSVTPVLVICH